MSRRLGAVGVGVVAITAAIMARLTIPDLSALARNVSFDAYQRLSPRSRGDVPVRIIDIDEASLAALGQWPWPRTRIAAMTERLARVGAAAIVFDILFPEPDATSPQRTAASIPVASEADRERLVALLAPLPDHDHVLAKAFEKAPVVLGFAIAQLPNERRPQLRAGIVFAGADPTTIVTQFEGAVPPLPVLDHVASGDGSVSLSRHDATGIVRRVPMLVSDGTRIYPSLSLEALRVAQRAASITIRSTGASGEDAAGGEAALVDVKVGEIRVPLTRNGQLWVYYDRDRPERYVSAHDLLTGDETALRKRIAGHIVFIGTSATGLMDIRATALGENVPGVSIHAQIAEQILGGDFIDRPDWADGLEIAATVLCSLLVIALLLMLGASSAFAVIAGVMLLIVGGAWLAFSRWGLLLEPSIPSLSAGVVFASVLGVLYFTGEREKRFIRQAFSQYLAPEVVRKLQEAPGLLKLGGETKPLTIMFMDIRSFTPIAERLSADELVSFLNNLLSPLSDAIFAEQGTIDKYIGDSIMAFWNAPIEVPDHPARACRAALAMRETLVGLNARDAFGFAARGWPDEVRIGIGVNSGTACVGNMGSDRRFNYSAIGNAVNAAARIEGSCKPLGADILIAETTAAAVSSFALLEAGQVELEGMSRPMTLFALVGDETLAASPAFAALARRHTELLALGPEADGDRKQAALEACRALAEPSLKTFYDQLELRLWSRSPGSPRAPQRRLVLHRTDRLETDL